MENLEIEGTPFSVLMEQAVKLKSESGKPFRRRYDTLPRYVQESMFASDEFQQLQSLPFFERYEVSYQLNEEGKAHFLKGDFHTSILKFQESLSLWHFVRNTAPEWKTKEIEDNFLEETVFHPERAQDKALLTSLQERLLCNLSRAHQRIGEGGQALSYLNEVLLRVNDKSVRALLRRAELKTSDPSAGGLELREAWEDLKLCRELGFDF